jgi:hypothetical protein
VTATPVGAGGEDAPELETAWLALVPRIGCRQCTEEYCGDCDTALHRMERAVYAVLRAGSAPPAAPDGERQEELAARLGDKLLAEYDLPVSDTEAADIIAFVRSASPPAAPDGQRTRPPSHGSGPSAARCTDPDCTLPHPGRAAPDGERRAVRGDEAERARNALIGAMDPDLRYGYCIGLLDDFESALRSASPQNPEAE